MWSSSITGSLVLVDLSAVLFRLTECLGFGLVASGGEGRERNLVSHPHLATDIVWKPF